MNKNIRSMMLAAGALLVSTAPAQAVNLFTNGDFENTGFGGTTGYYNLGPAGSGADHAVPGDFGWSVPVNNVDLIANGVYGPAQPGGAGGTYALDLVGYGSTGAISQTVATTPGHHYIVSFDYAGNNGVAHPSADVIVGGATLGTVTSDGTWHSYSRTFTATTTSTVVTLQEAFGANNGGVFLDNVALTAGFVAPVSAYAPMPRVYVPVNLLGNGNFENAGFGGTTGYYNIGNPGSGADHAVPSDFVWSVPVNNVDIIANGAYGPGLSSGGKYGLDLVGYGATGSISQPLTTVAGRRYVVSVDYAANSAFADPTAEISLGGTSIGTLTGTTNWQHFSKTIIGTGTTADFAFTELTGGNSGGVFLDNASVTAFIPEPATWAMMVAGFGLVGFAARRRAAAVAA